MIHEKQVRQLCAIHSVNNLLQLPSDTAIYRPSGDSDQRTMATVHEWVCHGRIIHECRQKTVGEATTDEVLDSNVGSDLGRRGKLWRVATQQEFDDIAKEFTLRELSLMNGDDPSFSTTTSGEEAFPSDGMTQAGRLSTMQRLRSQYGNWQAP